MNSTDMKREIKKEFKNLFKYVLIYTVIVIIIECIYMNYFFYGTLDLDFIAMLTMIDLLIVQLALNLYMVFKKLHKKNYSKGINSFCGILTAKHSIVILGVLVILYKLKVG